MSAESSVDVGARVRARVTRRLGVTVIVALAHAGIAHALEAQVSPAPAAPLPIRDNSFLIEEAYNQEWGVVQHIGTFQRVRGVAGWGATFTQEWPAPGERHQLSYTIPLDRGGSAGDVDTGLGDIALNYRYQLPIRPGAAVAVSPRLSALLPVGDEARGRGRGGPGLEVNMPISIDVTRLLVTHLNVGASWTPAARNAAGDEATTRGIFVGQSVILLLHPKLNVMVEALWSRDEAVVGADRIERDRAFVIAPGLRGAIDFPSGLQVVPGIAFPIGAGPSDGERGIFLYASFEHPFRRSVAPTLEAVRP